MTTDQIRLAELEEAKRHNLVLEPISLSQAQAAHESAAAAMARAGANYAAVSETARHNRIMEDIGWSDLYSQGVLRSSQAYKNRMDADLRADELKWKSTIDTSRLDLDAKKLGFTLVPWVAGTAGTLFGGGK